MIRSDISPYRQNLSSASPQVAQAGSKEQNSMRRSRKPYARTLATNHSPWTDKQLQQLIEGMQRYPNQWMVIAKECLHGERTNEQCRQKALQLNSSRVRKPKGEPAQEKRSIKAVRLSSQKARKSKWTREELDILAKGLEQSPVDWKRIKSDLKGCRDYFEIRKKAFKMSKELKDRSSREPPTKDSLEEVASGSVWLPENSLAMESDSDKIPNFIFYLPESLAIQVPSGLEHGEEKEAQVTLSSPPESLVHDPFLFLPQRQMAPAPAERGGAEEKDIPAIKDVQTTLSAIAESLPIPEIDDLLEALSDTQGGCTLNLHSSFDELVADVLKRSSGSNPAQTA